MIDFLTHYYKADSKPFLSLSSLEESEALKIMESLYIDDPIWCRFNNPEAYLRARKKTEAWLKKCFIEKGGMPKQNYPIYTVLGSCEMLEDKMDAAALSKIEIPLSLLDEDEVSFTFIDSMFSITLGEEKTKEYYQEEYHGKVFTLNEINGIILKKGLPSKGWWGNLPKDFFHYIEAQVWNSERVKELSF